MQQNVLKVSGMTCGHCAKTVERAARSVPGVEDARADVAAGALTVRGSADARAVAAAVRASGYDAEA
ncbi:MAG TPA: heavy-metal-associated domain-containing protein [Candidatus Thermoplasmatota archaeon]|nr:heavy-metal-associated domain-containing protein [Candidatus Thermoplasmatota archaeon]